MAAYYIKFTQAAQQALMAAQEEARRMGHNYVGTEHILLGVLSKGGKTVSQALGEIKTDEIREAIRDLVGEGDFTFTESFDYTPRSKKVLELSLMESRQLQHNYVGVEHILLALIRETDGIAARLLQEKGIDLRKARETLLSMMTNNAQSAGGAPSGQGESGETPILDQFGRDLTEAAKNGELDPVIGRTTEIERIIQILSRRTKNNPVLIGEPGVGKTAVVEGLAQRIVQGSIPELLKGKRVVALDLAGMLAGAKYRGEFEERLKNAMDELIKSKQVILFIDEIHTIIGAGASEGAIDAANILKPALARGEIQCIGATTLDEYRKHFEKDAALERRFQPVNVGEPTKAETIEIIKGLRDKYEAHHKVRITDAAIEAAVNLSDRYITDRFLPDKAIDLIDEAGSRVRIAKLTAPFDVKELEDQLAALKQEKEEAIAQQNFEKAASVRDEENQIRAKIEESRKAWEEKVNAKDGEVGEEEIATIVSQWTNIPVSKMTEDESNRLLHLEDILHQRVIGQDEAVKAISRAVRRARAGLKDPARPIGSFIFLGPTGVGKTELCKALGEALFGDEDSVIRIDMSEYMEKFSVSRMIGSPPGYVGYDEGGQLTDKVRTKPYSVILFDEIEKAHPDVFNILLQIMEDGRLTDGKGRTVDFRNTVIVMTSNVGAHTIRRQRTLGFANDGNENEEAYEMMKDNVMEELRRTFRPEFLNRVDELIVFHALEEEDIRKIAVLMFNAVAKRLEERNVYLHADESAIALLSKAGFDPEYGARPLRRAIQRMVEDSLSEELLSGKFKLGQHIVAYDQDGKLSFRLEEKEPAPAEA